MSPGCGLVPEYPYSACYRTPKCDLFSPNWKYDPHRAYFCRKFGQDQPNICPEVSDPCESIHEPLRSLDFFSAPPMYRRTACLPKFRYKKSTFEPDPCAAKCKLSCSCCPGIPQLPCCYCKPNPRPYGDAVCGLCKITDSPGLDSLHSPHTEPEVKNQASFRPDFGELPFTVEFTDPNANREPVIPKARSQVERCIHTSNARYLDTVYNDEFLDFWKLKSRDHMNLYRTQLAIEKRRPRPTIPSDSSDGNKVYDLSQPIYINAKAIRMKNKGRAPVKSYQVCIPGPITIG